MKNYKFVFGLLLSSVLSGAVHASAGNANADGPAMSDSGLSSTGLATVAEPVTRPERGLTDLDAIATSFSAVRTTIPVMDVPADHFISPLNVAQTLDQAPGQHAGQTLIADTKMAVHAAVAEDVAEPASEVLLLAGLSALAIAVRRQSKS